MPNLGLRLSLPGITLKVILGLKLVLPQSRTERIDEASYTDFKQEKDYS